MAERRVLLTVSGAIPTDLDAQVAAGLRPRTDYRVLAERLGADVVDVPRALAATGLPGRALHRVAGSGPLLAWFLLRQRRSYDVLFTDGEQVGLPYALLTRLFGRGRARHMMIVHVVSTRSKRAIFRLGGLARRIDRYVVYASRQAEVLRDELGVPSDRIELMPFMVDTRFYDPANASVPSDTRPVVCAVGRERRDYDTMLDAVDGLPVDVVITVGSLWSRARGTVQQRQLPSNVTVGRLEYTELRDLYARASLAVVPLEPVDFQAGVTAVLEAMAMARPVVCTRVPGQVDTIQDGVTGIYVAPGDPAALRAAVERVVADPELGARLGGAARDWVVTHADVDRYADTLARVVGDLASTSSRW